MRKVEEGMESLLSTRVAVPSVRRTQDTFILFDRESWQHDFFVVGNPIEVRYLPAKLDRDTPRLTHISLEEFNGQHMKLKTVFDEPNLVDADDLIAIRFNPSESFVADTNGL